MGRRRKGGRKGKKRTHVVDPAAQLTDQCFVLKRGRVGKTVQWLEEDLRRVMQPFTATKLREKKTNSLKDFLHVAGPLGVTNFLILSSTETASYLRLARLPRGPTLTFRIDSYTLSRDIVRLQLHPKSPGSEYKHPPLVVLNNFNFKGASKETHLMSILFQKLFPPINVQTIKLSDCKRVALFNYDAETKTVSFRHYLITVKQVGLSKSVKRIVQTQIPDLSKLRDVSEYVLREARASESDVEDEDAQVVIDEDDKGSSSASSSHSSWRQRKRAQQTARAATATGGAQRSAIRLQELGPRLQLHLIKVQEGFCEGEVVFHEYVNKTEEEIAELQEKKRQQALLKEQRRKEQEENLRKKGKLVGDATLEEYDYEDSDIERLEGQQEEEEEEQEEQEDDEGNEEDEEEEKREDEEYQSKKKVTPMKRRRSADTKSKPKKVVRFATTARKTKKQRSTSHPN
ncbi:rRNA-binding ribosome biosynthesis protein [Balamuthia mandrillaris]